MDAARTLVNAFVGCRLDYCDSLLAGVLTKLQSIQNAVTRLIIIRTRKFDSITPVIRDLHWLLVRRRIEFNIATLVYKCLNGVAAVSRRQSILVSAAPGRRHLRSADTRNLCVPLTNTSYGPRTFAVCGTAGLPFGTVCRMTCGQLIAVC